VCWEAVWGGEEGDNIDPALPRTCRAISRNGLSGLRALAPACRIAELRRAVGNACCEKPPASVVARFSVALK